MRWMRLLFLHWQVEADMLRPLVPACLEIDRFDGRAWVGLVPFTMTLRHRLTPGIPTARRFHECNVRTYVTGGDPGVPGVWFFSLDAASRLAVCAARAMWHLNYVHSRIDMSRDGDEAIHYQVRRVKRPDQGMACAWRPGRAIEWPSDPPSLPGRGPGGGSSPGIADDDQSSTTPPSHPHPGPLPQGRGSQALARFLTDRYAMYAVDKRGRCWRGRVWHPPWSLRDAEVLELNDGLVRSAGIEIDASAPPLAYCADAMDVEAWPLERV